MKKCITILAMLLFATIASFAQNTTVLDSISFSCSTTAQEGVLWFAKGETWGQPIAAVKSGWSIVHEFKSSASGTVEIKYTEQFSDLNGDGTADEYDDNSWTTLESSRTYDTTTNLWFSHSLLLNRCFGVRVYVDHSDATGTHVIWLNGPDRN